MRISEKLSALRKRCGLSQMEVSEELGVSRQAVSKWEVGDTVPSATNLQCLAKLYRVPLEYLIDDDLDEIPVSVPAAPAMSTDSDEAPAAAPAAPIDTGRERFWKKLAIGALVLCGILTLFLFHFLIIERPEDHSDSVWIGTLEEKSIEISGGFDLE